MDAAPAAPEPSPPPVTYGSADLAPTRIGRLLSLVRRLMFYGENLAVSVQQQAGTRYFPVLVRPFGTLNLTLILARIACGLRRAAALEAMLVQRVMSGRDVTPAPLRVYVPREAGIPRPPAAPRTDQPRDPLLAALPTAEEIAEDVRRRPVGAVLADICRDFGIRPGDVDAAFWWELNLTITEYGGGMIAYLKDMISWVGRIPDEQFAEGPSAAPAPSPEPREAAPDNDASAEVAAPLPEPCAPVPVAHDATGPPPEDIAEPLAA